MSIKGHLQVYLAIVLDNWDRHSHYKLQRVLGKDLPKSPLQEEGSYREQRPSKFVLHCPRRHSEAAGGSRVNLGRS